MKYLITSNRWLVLSVTLLVFGLGMIGCSKSQQVEGIAEEVSEEGGPSDEIGVATPIDVGIELPPEEETEVPTVPEQPQPDAQAPSVISTNPADGSVSVSHYGLIRAKEGQTPLPPIKPPKKIIITFDEEIDASGAEVSSLQLSPLVGVSSVTPLGTQSVSFTLEEPLAVDTKYEATLKKGVIKDVSENAMKADYTWHFKSAPCGDGLGLLPCPTVENILEKISTEKIIAEKISTEKKHEGLYLSDESKFKLPAVGSKQKDGTDFSGPCNIDVCLTKDCEPTKNNVVTELDVMASNDGIHQLEIGCNDIGSLGKPGLSPAMLPSAGKELGGQYTIKPPLGFVLAGWYAQSGLNDVESIIPYAKKLDVWGVNDEVLWSGKQLGHPVAGLSKWQLYLCPKGSVLSWVSGQFYNTSYKTPMFGVEKLNLLEGFCRKVVNDDVAKPKVASVELIKSQKIEAPIGIVAKPCVLSCQDEKHPNGVVVGFEAVTSKKLIEGIKVIKEVQLLCKDVTTAGLEPKGSKYRKTGSCGFLPPDEQHKRITISPGFAANGIYARAGDLFDQLAFYGTPVDVFDDGSPVNAGENNGNVLSSVKAGGKGGGQKLEEYCPQHKVITKITFSAGNFNFEPGTDAYAGTEYGIPVVFGIRDFTCAKVDRTFGERIETLKQ
ncbi:MAG: Ig-like domain-containing protein [Pseudomonadota bacterium]